MLPDSREQAAGNVAYRIEREAEVLYATAPAGDTGNCFVRNLEARERGDEKDRYKICCEQDDAMWEWMSASIKK